MLTKYTQPSNIIILLLCLSFCHGQVVQAKEVPAVTILADDSYPPYSYVEDGQLKGIYVDIVRAAMKLINSHYQVKLIAAPWKRALMEVKEGKVIGILPPYKHIEDRPYIWPYSLAIMTETVVAYCHDDINIFEYLSDTSQRVLLPLNIGINSGYMIFNDGMKAAIATKKMIVWENKSTNANLLKLQTKRIDCYLNDRLSIQHGLLKFDKKRQINFNDISESLIVMTQTAHIGYSHSTGQTFSFKNDFVQRMDEALIKVMASEKYESIIAFYTELQ